MPSEHCVAHIVHCEYVLGWWLLSTLSCNTLSSLWGALSDNKCHSSFFPLCWTGLCVHKVPSGKFSSVISLSLSGCCYWSETLLPPLWSTPDVPWVEANHTTPSSLFAGLLLHESILCTVAKSLFWVNSPCLQQTIPNKHLAFHTDYLFDLSRDYVGHGPSLFLS